MPNFGFRLKETARGQKFVAVYDGYLCLLSHQASGWRWSVESGGGLTLRGPEDACIIHVEGVAETPMDAEAQMLRWLEANAELHPEIPLHNPSPDDVRNVRKRLKLTQLAAAQVTSVADGKSYRSWQNFETAKDKKNHRQIPRGTWELFLLLTNQHPHYFLVSRVNHPQQNPDKVS